MSWRAVPILGVPDVAVALEYFQTKLGFTRTGSHTPEDEMVYAIVERGGAVLHLQIRRGPSPSERQSHETDAFLLVDDVDGTYAEYQTKEVAMLRPLQDEPYGVRDFTIETPMGPRVAFATELSG
ncbi:MAG: glyoxalase superfamily protein [Myxococcota bacterium]